MNKRAFTLVELLVSVVVSSILVAATVQVYSLFRTTMMRDQAMSDSMQNARVALDRLSRDLRQTGDVVTELPSYTIPDLEISQPHAIEFEDGHANDLTYRYYYLSGTTLRMQTKRYYFTGQTGTNVHWDTIGTEGASPVVADVGNPLDVADMVQELNVYYEDGIYIIEMLTGDGVVNMPVRTSIIGRNI